MNISALLLFIQQSNISQAILLLYLAIAVIIAGYNWLYLYHSIHVTTKHMGLNAPIYMGNLIKISIFLALLTAALSGIFFVIGS
jgi:hypothetical protein